MQAEHTGSARAERASEQKLTIDRFFTTDLRTPEGFTSPLDAVEKDHRTAQVKRSDGSIIFKMDDVECPKDWSQASVDIAANKYFRKAGVPDGNGGGPERSVFDMVHRVALAIRRSGEEQGYFDAHNAEAFQHELEHLLIHQKAAFNSPVWFNVGLSEKYGIKGSPAGNWYYEPGTKEGDNPIRLAEDSYTHPQCSACFILTVQDDLMDIAGEIAREMRLFKYGSGAGSNFSTLRGEGEPLSNGGTSSGLLSFLKILDTSAGAIKSGGTTRRAAKMVVVDIDHPDIHAFIDWKMREEDKARALIAAGYSGGMDGEAVSTISGQNANNSVRVTDAFMRAVVDDDEFETHWRTDPSQVQRFNARETFKRIAHAAWRCADPGLHFQDTINRWHTCPQTAPIRASNPCSEYLFIDDSACNLASLNLVRFERPDGTFDVKGFIAASRIMFIAQEILVDYASYPSAEIAHNSHVYRPLGLGYANLGALLMRAGHPYDSESGRRYAAAITSILTGSVYAMSAEMARVLGPFEGFAHNRQSMLRVMGQHRDAAYRLRPNGVGDAFAPLFETAQEQWDMALGLGERHGYRNAQATLLAPTGTIAFMMGCDTTGIEPDYQLVKHKKLAGGGVMRIANLSIPVALRRMGYSNEEIQNIIDHVETHSTIEDAPGIRAQHLPVFDCAVRCGKNGKRFISPKGHLLMMAAVQPFLSGAISKTINVPSNTTADEIEKLYMLAWREGLKAIALYRDNSKVTQVLGEDVSAAAAQARPRRRRLPKKRYGFTQESKVGGAKVFIRTGEYEDGTLGEIFVDMAKDGAALRSWANCFAMSISLGLQHGVPLEKYVAMFTFTKFEPSGTVQDHPHIRRSTSVVDYIFRVLGLEYLNRTDLCQVPPEELAEEIVEVVRDTAAAVKQEAVERTDAPFCQRCGEVTIRTGTCYSCAKCGYNEGCA